MESRVIGERGDWIGPGGGTLSGDGWWILSWAECERVRAGTNLAKQNWDRSPPGCFLNSRSAPTGRNASGGWS
jgi:hypothetical protein